MYVGSNVGSYAGSNGGGAGSHFGPGAGSYAGSGAGSHPTAEELARTRAPKLARTLGLVLARTGALALALAPTPVPSRLIRWQWARQVSRERAQMLCRYSDVCLLVLLCLCAELCAQCPHK